MRRALGSILALSCLALPLFAEDEKGCDPGPAWWYEFRHKEAGGVGYGDGYTTGAIFLSPKWDYPYQPFVDFRLNVFNNGKWDTNAGFGFRHMTGCLAYGVNAYWDYRDTNELGAVFQLGAGFELLSRYIDFRLNGYGPVGKSRGAECPEFSHFCANSAFAKQELSAVLPHADAELGFPLRKLGPVDLYFGVGGYYLFERTVESMNLGKAWGGKARVEIDFYDALFIGGSVTYDEIFHVRPQGYIGFSLPLGPRNVRWGSRRFAKKFPAPCTKRAEEIAILTQRVEREEIIPLQNKNGYYSLLPAGVNSRILFVDGGAGGSLGTYESPFETLVEAEAASLPGDILYVFPGDESLEGITLQDDQRLIGSAASFNLCDVCVPAFTPCCYPTIASTMTSNGVLLADNNEVAGFTVLGPTGEGTPTGINVDFAADFYIHQLAIEEFISGIAIGNPSMVVSPAGCKTISDVSIKNNDASTMGIDLTSEAGSIFVDQVQIEGTGGQQVFIQMNGVGEISIANSTFSGSITPTSSLVEVMTLANGTDLSVRNNVFFPFSSLDDALLLELGGGGQVCIESNCGEGIISVQTDPELSIDMPVCLRLSGNALSAYQLYNAGENLALRVESKDGSPSGVDELNESGSTSVTLPSNEVDFVCPGTCECCR